MYQEQKEHIQMKSKWKMILIPLIISAIVLAVIPGIFDLIFGLFLPSSEEINTTPASAVSMIVTVVLSGLLMCRVSKMSFEDLGWHKSGAIREIVKGAIGGFLSISVIAIVALLLGGIKLEYVFSSSATFGIFSAFVFYMFQGTWEELVMRSYLMPNFAKVIGDRWAIIITSVIFAALHGANPNAQFLPIFNLFLFGLAFAIIYYKTGSLWICGVGHGFWNFTMGHLYGAEVSGTIVKDSIFKSIPQAGKEFISGGLFGYEGSIITTVVGIILIIAFWKLIKDKK